MNQDQVKAKLMQIEPNVPEFTVIFSGKNSRRVDGLYHPDKKEIIIHNKNHEDDNALMYTAIHEFAHHVHFCSSDKPIFSRSHTTAFWNIFHSLLYKAEELKIHKNVFASYPEFVELTRGIKTKFLSENGKLMKEFGKYLLEAQRLCQKYNASFEDYVDRILNLPRSSAKSMIQSHVLDINPSIGYENMKTVASIKDKTKRVEAEKAFIEGHSAEMVKMQFKAPEPLPPLPPVERLLKEKSLLLKRMRSLETKIQVLDQKILEYESSGESSSPEEV